MEKCVIERRNIQKIEKHLEKNRKLFAAFMNLEKTHERVDRKGL